MSVKKNIIWLASYPKSGNTWCRLFIASYLKKFTNNLDINNIQIGTIFSSKTIIENYAGIDISEFKTNEINNLRKYAFANWAQSYDEDVYVKTHDAYILDSSNKNMFPIEETKCAIYFIRNPLDVCVSFSNHMNCSYEKAVKKMCDNNFSISASKKKYNSQVEQKLLSWQLHVKSWTEQTDMPVLVVKYEDMLINPEKEFKKILKFVGIKINLTELKNSVKICSFKNLKTNEKKFGFKEKPTNCKSFFNVGKSGYYKNLLSTEQINKIINTQHYVMKIFGYI